LLGLIKKAAGDHGSALECFGKALYLDPACEEALVHSALIHEHAGDEQAARQFRARAERVARRSGP
jgi:chemotaxis protein methyltransferase WspC